MRIGIPRESRPGENLVAATIKSAGQLAALGYEVTIESGAGERAGQADEAYSAAGIRVASPGDVWSSDVILKVNAPTDEEIERLSTGATIVAQMAPARSPELLDKLQRAGVTALAIDAVPRISRAQSMDVLSSQANVAGYRAVIEAAHEFSRMFTGQVTAAGKTAPAKFFVVGAGVAGLAAIGAASAMGAVVRAFDVRPEVAEQIESLGATFVTVDDTKFASPASSDGYAKEMTAEQELATARMYDEEARNADIVITTALIPGRPAPKLVTAETILQMQPGSVIVDMAAANGGNTGLCRAGEKVVTAHGVTILGYTDLAGRLPAQTSQLFGTNVVNLLKLLTPEKDGRLTLAMDDVVQRGITVVRDGESMWPPPPVTVSAAPVATPGPPTVLRPEKAPRSMGSKLALALAGAASLLVLVAISPAVLQAQLVTFALAIVIGYYVITGVHHALHTPLMSVTNAISGIIVVGAILQIGHDGPVVTGLATLAILVASINIFGGFAVTRRMLSMFSRS